MHATARRGFAQPALPAWVSKIFMFFTTGLVIVLFLAFFWVVLPKHDSRPTAAPQPSGPPRIIVYPGQTPSLVHGRQTLVVAPGTTGCIKPAAGDTQLNFDTHESRQSREKNLVAVIKECDVAGGIRADAPPGKYDRVSAYSFKVVNDSQEPVPVTTYSW